MDINFPARSPGQRPQLCRLPVIEKNSQAEKVGRLSATVSLALPLSPCPNISNAFSMDHGIPNHTSNLLPQVRGGRPSPGGAVCRPSSPYLASQLEDSSFSSRQRLNCLRRAPVRDRVAALPTPRSIISPFRQLNVLSTVQQAFTPIGVDKSSEERPFLVRFARSCTCRQGFLLSFLEHQRQTKCLSTLPQSIFVLHDSADKHLSFCFDRYGRNVAFAITTFH